MNPRPEALWLGLQFPHLSLDLASRGDPRFRKQPLAISDGTPHGQQVYDCNPPAARAGIRIGMPVNAALGLFGELQLKARDTHTEHLALERLAAWCYQYSSQVCLLPGRAALTLEAGASRRLFGSPETLSRELDAALLRMGYHARSGSAPTPEAAQLAARHGLHLAQAAELRRDLGPLPLDSLHLPAAQRAALAKTGFSTVGELLRLPRKALARRMGPATVDYLDRLTGSRPDPLKTWQAPARFSTTLDLAPEITGSQALLFPLRRLVSELCGTLRGSDHGVQAMEFHLRLDRGDQPEMILRLGLQQPTRSEEHILLLLRERLERLILPAPVRAIRLEAGALLPYDARQDGLFEDDPDGSTQSLAPLLERLQARLGWDAVQGLKGVEDHRPERSWATRKPDEPAPCAPMPHRPVWLFAHPRRCRIEDYRVLAGPERIETGWWDGHDCRRDYFVVRDCQGSMLWAFHEHKPRPGWYLQGMFS